METKNDRPIDRAGWPSGPWDDEPEDRVDFTHCGFACLLHRNHMGSWCGYVGLPPEHPDFGKDYDDIEVEVHGGLTYADRCGQYIGLGVGDERWWVGFDTSHFRDIVPGMLAFGMKHGWASPPGLTYWTRDRATVETQRLADQLRIHGEAKHESA